MAPADALDPLIEREVERALGELQREHPRALADNPEGAALIAGALRDSIRLGLAAGCTLEGCSVGDLEHDRESAWEEWWRIREQSPEAGAWPPLLASGAPGAVDQAIELAQAAALELNLHGRAERSLKRAGSQAAEAGAALAHALSRPSPADEMPVEAVPARPGGTLPDGRVGVAFAANLAEAELLQGALEAAGIPSILKRTGGDYPGLLAAGYREIYVPGAAADEARAVLATSSEPSGDEAPAAVEPPTRKVGNERTALRLAGKVAAAVIVMSWLWAFIVAPGVGPALTIVWVVVFIGAVAAILASR